MPVSYHDLWVPTWSSLWCPLWMQFPPSQSLSQPQPSLCCLSTPTLLSPVGLFTWCPLCLECSSSCCWRLDHILSGLHISVHKARIPPVSSCFWVFSLVRASSASVNGQSEGPEKSCPWKQPSTNEMGVGVSISQLPQPFGWEGDLEACVFHWIPEVLPQV